MNFGNLNAGETELDAVIRVTTEFNRSIETRKNAGAKVTETHTAVWAALDNYVHETEFWAKNENHKVWVSASKVYEAAVDAYEAAEAAVFKARDAYNLTGTYVDIA